LKRLKFDWSQLDAQAFPVGIKGIGGNGYAEGPYAADDLSKEDMDGLNAYLPHSQTLSILNLMFPSVMERNGCLHIIGPQVDEAQSTGGDFE
jgi:hypothetical protein